MRNLKKVLSLTLALVMLIGMMVVGAGAATYTDTVDSDKQEAIEVTSAVEIITGDGNGTFRPDGTLRRSEAAVIIARVLLTNSVVTKLGSTDCQFTDVTDDWAKAPIQYCANVGIINGRSATSFDPNANVTGVEFAKMLMCVLDDTKDYTASRNWKLDVQRDALAAKLDTNDVPLTDAALSREDAAQMAFNAIQYSPSGAKSYKVGSLTFDNVMDAFIAADGKAENIEITTAKDSLAATRFNLTEGTKDDGLGHTLKTWSVNKDEVYAASISSETPVKTYTTKVTSVAKDLNGYTYASDLKATVNGAAGDPINSATGIQDLTKNGKTVEVYANSSKVITKVIVIERTVATLSADPSTRDKDGTEQVRVPGAISAWTDASKVTGWEDLAKGDVVLWVKGNDGKYDIKKADTITGTATAYSGTKGVRVDGDYFPASALTGGSPTLGSWNDSASDKFTAEYTFYLDEGNCVVKVEKADGSASTESNYAIVRDVAWFPGSGFTPDGHMEAVILKTDGTYETVTVASVDGVVPVRVGYTPACVTDAGTNENKVFSQEVASLTDAVKANLTTGADINADTSNGPKATTDGKFSLFSAPSTGTPSTNSKITDRYYGATNANLDNLVTKDQFYTYTVDSDDNYVLCNLSSDEKGHLKNSPITTNAVRFDGQNLGNANTVFLFDNGANKAPDIYTGIGEVPNTSGIPSNAGTSVVTIVKGADNFAKFVFVKGVTASSTSSDIVYIADGNAGVTTSNGVEYAAFVNGDDDVITVANKVDAGLYSVDRVNDKGVSTLTSIVMTQNIKSNGTGVIVLTDGTTETPYVHDDDTLVYVISSDGATCDQIVASEIEADANDLAYVFYDRNNNNRADTIYVVKVDAPVPASVTLAKGTINGTEGTVTNFNDQNVGSVTNWESTKPTIKITMGTIPANHDTTISLSGSAVDADNDYTLGNDITLKGAGTVIVNIEIKDRFSGSTERYTYTINVTAKEAE